MASANEQIDLMIFTDVNEFIKRIDAGLVTYTVNTFLTKKVLKLMRFIIDDYGPVERLNIMVYQMKNTVRLIMMNKDCL